MKYDETAMPEHYNAARALPEETMALWLDAIAERVPADQIDRILDLGCGTGRFTARLSDQFDASVVGVDPSVKMLAEARDSVDHPRVEFREGSAESLPLEDESICLIYMSMVYHHVEDLARAVSEFARVSRPGGFLCIRNSTLDLLGDVPYLRFFPAALEFNKGRLPSRRDVIDTMQDGGFASVSHDVIRQQFAGSFREYYDKVRQRGLSDLSHISDSEFGAGIESMREAAEQEKRPEPVVEPIDLFVFTKEAE